MKVFTIDILPHICEHMTCLQHLNLLSRVNKSLNTHINRSLHDPWLRIGRATCGEGYWNEELFAHVLDGKDGRYTAKLHMCPWLSMPETFDLHTLRAYEAMETTVELKSLKIRDDYMECAEPFDHELHLRVQVHDSPHAKGGPRLISRCAREAEARDSVHVAEDVVEEDATTKDDTDANLLPIDIEVHLECDDAFMRFAKRYGLGDLACVKVVHAQMFAAIFDEGRTWRHSTILFISMNDHTKILHDFRLTDCASECVAFRPGEMWYVHCGDGIKYHGPREDKHTAAFSLKGNGLISRAFYAVANGRAREAVNLLKPLQLDDLSEIYIPKTTLNLFDIAADTDGRAFQLRDIQLLMDGAPLDTKADPAILDVPLPPDAQYLLQIEPRFATSIHMLKRAIRAMDVERACALLEAGCPWISQADVVDALPPGMGYEEAMECLRPCRLRVTYRY